MKSRLANSKGFELNAICPYFTMFPLEYPINILKKYKNTDTVVLDPFCGRGTTIYAARKHGLTAYGLDTSPIAVAIAQAKLAKTSVDEVLDMASDMLKIAPLELPDTDFFHHAFSTRTLREICSLREGLSTRRTSNAIAVLKAVTLGCLHGPLPEGTGTPSYLSNQMPRTFSSKPDYSVRFWKARDLMPPNVSLLDVIRKKLERITDLSNDPHGRPNNIRCEDARLQSSYRKIPKASVTVTSPPYYGMRTYVQDQWLRMWFLGGPDRVEYENNKQLNHGGHETFISELAKVWVNVAEASAPNAHLYIRFGSISSAKSDAREILKASLQISERWRTVSIRTAETADSGKRQADQMGRDSKAAEEFDFHAVLA